MKYILDDKEFYSVKELAIYAGINEKTITARLRKGMSVADACVKKDFRCKYFNYKNNEEKSISEICREEEKDSSLIRNRLKYGYSLKDALNKPKKISRQGKAIIVNGILYNSISMACRKLELEEKENVIRRRLRAGKTADEAFKF